MPNFHVQKCDGTSFVDGEFVRCFGNIVNKIVEGDGSSPEEHKVCEKCGKDFGNVQVESPLDLIISHGQTILKF